ncbi:MAG: aspartate/glutamate racemase family protein, partial [Halomonas sp.]
MRLRLINPNTTVGMTTTIGEAARRVAATGTEIVATQPEHGPVSIESHFDEAISAVGVLEQVLTGEREGADAYIIACFGDPGLLAARELTRAPVIGIALALNGAAGYKYGI